MTVKHIAEVEAKKVAAGEQTTIQVLIPATEGPNFAMRRFVMQPGGGMPLHTNTVEHEQYVLAGRARIGIDGEDFFVQQGDVVFIPEGVPHYYQNIGDEPFEFLCMIPNKPDEIKLVGEGC
jgi:quercetin dioxygenase-like cupin family protein